MGGTRRRGPYSGAAVSAEAAESGQLTMSISADRATVARMVAALAGPLGSEAPG
jgi:hypothetical protein